MKKGWISLHRKIQDHWLWKEKPFDKRSAWIDLLMMANHKSNKFLLGNELLQVDEGSFITSQSKLMKRWGWGNTRVRNFLKLLKEDGMINYYGKKHTVVEILNYENYQKQTDPNQVIPIDMTEQQTDSKPTANTNNNDNNDNNDNNISLSQQTCDEKTTLKFDESSTEIQLARFMRQEMLRTKPNSRVPKNDVASLQKWAQHIDRAIRLDKRTPKELATLFRWAQEDSFWSANIRSPQKLREQFDALEIRRKKEQPQGDKRLQKLGEMYRKALQEEQKGGRA